MMEILREAGDGDDRMNYADFVRIVAFHPNVGYYAKANERVGRSPETDFYTSESLGEVFGKLVVATSINLLGSEKSARQHVFVEIGAEPGKCILDNVEHPFAKTVTLRLDDPLLIPEKALVFANEWLDSLPFHRLRFDEEEGWQELGVEIGRRNLRQTILPALTPAVETIKHRLPDDMR
ncbi:MAG: SAM-dependent methyltransferase, partial [Opitutales bacterium]